MIAALIIVAMVVAGGYVYWTRLFGDDPTPDRRRFWAWAAKGLAFPLAVWTLCNFNLLPGMSPLIPEIGDIDDTGWAKFLALCRVTGPSLPAIAGAWGAITLAWLFAEIQQRVENRRETLFIAGVLTLFAIPFVILVLRLFGLASAGFAGILWLLPVVHLCSHFTDKTAPVPSYARAVAQLKRGKYREAEHEVIGQLEKKEDDIEGWLMLADMYANQQRDLGAADRVIRDLCDQPNVTPARAAVALHQLADWHLKLGEDPVAARRALETIEAKYPDSHFARMARQRIDQLPADREELVDQTATKRFRLPALNESTADEIHAAATATTRKASAAEANQLAEKLKRNPNNIRAREQFAIILADRLEKPDLGIEQVELLLNLADQPDAKRAEWLGMIAVWHARHRHDPAAARRVLERIIRDYPRLPQAFAARRQIELMEMEQIVQATPAEPPRLVVRLND